MSVELDYQTWLLSIDLWREDRGAKTHQEKVGAGYVVKNRAAHPGWWGTTIIQVITHKWQFSSMGAPGDPNLVLWPQKEVGEGDPVWDDCVEAAQEVIDGDDPDPTNGATYYYSAPLVAPPKEWGPVEETVKIGGLTFCKQVAG